MTEDEIKHIIKNLTPKDIAHVVSVFKLELPESHEHLKTLLGDLMSVLTRYRCGLVEGEESLSASDCFDALLLAQTTIMALVSQKDHDEVRVLWERMSLFCTDLSNVYFPTESDEPKH